MHNIYEGLIASHIAIGSLCLITFWLSYILRKRNSHRFIGKIYEYATYLGSFFSIIVSALVLSSPSEIHPDRPVGQTISFNIVLLFLSLIPTITIQLSGFLIKEKTPDQYIKANKISFLAFGILGGVTIWIATLFAPHVVIFTLMLTYFLVLRLLGCSYLSFKTSPSFLVRKKYHTLLAFSSGTALHVGLFAGGTFVRFFSHNSALSGLNLFLPLGTGLLIEVIFTLKYNKQIATAL